MSVCERWTIKKADHWRIDAFELWCWRRLFRVPWIQGDQTSPFWRRSVLGVRKTNTQEGTGRTDAEAETPILWPPEAKSWLIWKDPEAGKDLRQEKKGRQRMRWLDGITNLMDMSEHTPGVGDRQGSLACCCSWGHKELDTTERLNWTEDTRKHESLDRETQGQLVQLLHFFPTATCKAGIVIPKLQRRKQIQGGLSVCQKACTD